jgi:hypothetical protein
MNMFRSNEIPASLGIYKGDGPTEAADDLWEAIRTRKLVGISGSLMLGAKQWTVFANVTGFGIQVIGASGTGIVIAVGKRAIVYADGTNVVRVTADV